MAVTVNSDNNLYTDPEWVEMQTKLAFQEDTVLQLSDMIATQQQEIMKLQSQMKQLIKELGSVLGDQGDNNSSQSGAVDQKPPHY
ncbi:MAG: SlyX family protein [Sinobacterium sp.]|nr:SlyX family protein [Sinobacterium sp.]